MRGIALELYVEGNLQLRKDGGPREELAPCYDYRSQRVGTWQVNELKGIRVLEKNKSLSCAGFADYHPARGAWTENKLRKGLPPGQPTLAPGIPAEGIAIARLPL